MVSAVVFFRVQNIYKALFEVNDLDGAVRNHCMQVLRTVLQGLDGVDDIKDIKRVSGLLASEARAKFTEWGVELIEFGLINCAPSRETATFITASAAVQARMKALKASDADKNPMLAAALLGAPAVAALTEPEQVPGS